MKLFLKRPKRFARTLIKVLWYWLSLSFVRLKASIVNRQDDKITIIWVDALSYVGTTWLNLVLGSHPKVLTIGPPRRLWSLRNKGFENANLVWGKNDTFWTGFAQFWDQRQNFFKALSDYSGRTHFIFDNPDPDFISATIAGRRFNILRLRYCRDARAVTASYARKFLDQNDELDYIKSIAPGGWFFAAFQGLDPAKRTSASLRRRRREP